MDTKGFFKKSGNFIKAVVRMKFKKYLLVLVLGVVIVGFLGDNSVAGHLRNKARINQLKEEIAHNKAITETNLAQTHALQTDVKAIERIGRVRYFMKNDDEDVFVLSDDNVLPKDETADETVE